MRLNYFKFPNNGFFILSSILIHLIIISLIRISSPCRPVLKKKDRSPIHVINLIPPKKKLALDKKPLIVAKKSHKQIPSTRTSSRRLKTTIPPKVADTYKIQKPSTIRKTSNSDRYRELTYSHRDLTEKVMRGEKKDSNVLISSRPNIIDKEISKGEKKQLNLEENIIKPIDYERDLEIDRAGMDSFKERDAYNLFQEIPKNEVKESPSSVRVSKKNNNFDISDPLEMDIKSVGTVGFPLKDKKDIDELSGYKFKKNNIPYESEGITQDRFYKHNLPGDDVRKPLSDEHEKLPKGLDDIDLMVMPHEENTEVAKAEGNKPPEHIPTGGKNTYLPDKFESSSWEERLKEDEVLDLPLISRNNKQPTFPTTSYPHNDPAKPIHSGEKDESLLSMKVSSKKEPISYSETKPSMEDDSILYNPAEGSTEVSSSQKDKNIPDLIEYPQKKNPTGFGDTGINKNKGISKNMPEFFYEGSEGLNSTEKNYNELDNLDVNKKKATKAHNVNDNKSVEYQLPIQEGQLKQNYQNDGSRGKIKPINSKGNLKITSPLSGTTDKMSHLIEGSVDDYSVGTVLLSVNDKVTTVTVDNKGYFSHEIALESEKNNIRVVAADAIGNNLEDAIKLTYKPSSSSAYKIEIYEPKNNSLKDTSEDPAILVKWRVNDKDVRIKEGWLIYNNYPMRLEVDNKFEQKLVLLQERNSIEIEAVTSKGVTLKSEKITVEASIFPKDILILLTWDNPKADLDLHVYGPGDTHTYRMARYDYETNAIPNAQLDQDTQEGYGPEVFTGYELLQGTYTVRVNFHTLLRNSTKDTTTARIKIIFYPDDSRRRTEDYSQLIKYTPIDKDDKWTVTRFKMP
ncbi:MAG: hypothetical protein V1872_14630 [bacterium]